jgi:hypothetical protein
MKQKMSKLNITARTGIYFIILIMGAFVGYLLEGDPLPIAALCFGTAFLASVIEEDLLTR